MYDSLAAYYHLIFENWDASIERQARVLGALLESACSARPLKILDAACGIGTQALGLAMRGHVVTGSDISAQATARARVEAESRNVSIPLYVADMRDLPAPPAGRFDAVLIADNALAHLATDSDLCQMARSAARQLAPGGVLLASLRDYDKLVEARPAMQGPAFYSDDGRRRIVHQIWDWTAERRYTTHLYITRETDAGWECHHFASEMHAWSRSAINAALEAAGFHDVRWIEPAGGYYQPIVLARFPQCPNPK